MRTFTIAIALAFMPAIAAAQTTGHGAHGAGHEAHNAAKPAAKVACPLHLTTLQLTAAQEATFQTIRTAHEAEMKQLHAQLMPGMKHEAGQQHDAKTHAQHMASVPAEAKAKAHEAMRASMKKSAAAARAVLSGGQLPKFDAALKECEAKCEECCAAGCASHGGHAKHEE